MPTPVGHTLAAAILYQSKNNKSNSLIFLAALWFFALLPDIDFVFGFFHGNPNLYHHRFTHSFFFVILCGISGGWVYGLWRKQNVFAAAFAFSLAGISHIVLDVLAVDQRAPYGCPVAWPFSNAYFISPLLVFSDVSRSSDNQSFFKSLWNWHNAQTVAIEVMVLGAGLFIVWILSRRNHG